MLHASKKPLEALGYAKLPCSVYLVEGTPVVKDIDKCGFTHLTVLEEIPSNVLDELFGFKFLEACNHINPFLVQAGKVGEEEIELLKQWDSVWASVWASVRDSVGASVWASVWDSVRDSVRDSVWDSVQDSVRDSVWAYTGSLFFNIKKWKGIEHEEGVYPFQSAVNLWHRGFIPVKLDTKWGLYSAKYKTVIYENV